MAKSFAALPDGTTMNSIPETQRVYPGCHICGGDSLQLIPQFAELCRVSSDSRAFRRQGKLGVCPSCGIAQKHVDDQWRADTEQIYRDYTIYELADGAEQVVFVNGVSIPRSTRIVEYVLNHVNLPPEGRALDIGCGNGAFLRALNKARGSWRLTGSELSTKNQAAVEAIPGVEAFHAGPLQTLKGGFHLISLIHVLEHLPNPIAFLVEVRKLLQPRGLLVIEVPNWNENPFDLLIADHSTHFDADGLTAVVRAAGFELIASSSEWIRKELTLLAIPGSSQPLASPKKNGDASQRLEKPVQWLHSLAASARAAARTQRLGIFGSANAATWLAHELGDQVAFFVDEDTLRQGKHYLGRPVYAPKDIPAGSTLYFPLPRSVAIEIQSRLNKTALDCNCVIPPEL